MTKPSWGERYRRAGELAAVWPFARELLDFYQQITHFQEGLYNRIQSAGGAALEPRRNGSLRDELDLAVLLPQFPAFLSVIEQAAPQPLSLAARDLAQKGADTWLEMLTQYWTRAANQAGAASPPDRGFFAQAFLQPYAEYLADNAAVVPTQDTVPVCPRCKSQALVAVLRPEGDGAKRSLVCSLCSTEWEFRRILCPACLEDDERKLAVYTAEQFNYVRVDGCETCKTYLKTVDLTKNGRAVPVVDELASVPLNLWAQENGYTKLQCNLLGL